MLAFLLKLLTVVVLLVSAHTLYSSSAEPSPTAGTSSAPAAAAVEPATPTEPALVGERCYGSTPGLGPGSRGSTPRSPTTVTATVLIQCSPAWAALHPVQCSTD